jgi:enterochelin esterase family protein
MFLENLRTQELHKFDVKTLKIESEVLKDNPLGDSPVKYNPVLLPKIKAEYQCVVYLSGFTGNGSKNFNFKSFEKNFIDELDEWTTSGALAPKIYLFVDAWTTWGGSQFINSKGCGDYEDYIVKELLPELENLEGYSVSDYAVMGGSSGGYGALHLSSKYPEIFSHCLAVAPDCDFEVSLKPEIYHAFADITNNGGVLEVYKKLKAGEFKTSHKSFHTMVNVLAMAACYSKVDSSGMPLLPLEKEGGFDQELWSEWLKKDPLYFLKDRIKNIKKLKTFFLSVGEFDQFLLQYGARKIRKMLLEQNVDLNYEEFKGNHFDISTRRKKALSLI